MKFISQSRIIIQKPKSIDAYLEKIGIEQFGGLDVYSTAGDIRPLYPFQWIAKSIPFGDDPFEGIGGTPFEAIKELYKKMKDNKVLIIK